MTAMRSVLQGNPEAGEALLALMSECCDLREFGAEVMRLALNALMSAEADAACGAAYGSRSEGRTNSRNGYRPRTLKTGVGDVELEVPKLRKGTYYPGSVLSRWSRVEASLAALVVEAYVNGVSTRDMALLAESLGVSSLSASEVSRLTAGLDAQVDGLRSRDLSDQRYCYLWVDATYVRCRVSGRSVSQAVVTAIALGEDGRKRLVGLDCVDTESYGDWRAFLASIRARGLSGLVLCVSDAHAGLTRALSEVFQGVAWQRCTVHLQRDVSRAVKRRAGERVVRELAKAVFAEGDALVARALYPRACDAIRAAGEAAAADVLEGAAGDAQQYLSLPREHWARVRTNNVLCLVKHAFRKCADKTFGFVLETFSGFVTPAPGPAAAAAGRILLERYRVVDVGRGRADRQEHLDVAGVARRRGGGDLDGAPGQERRRTRLDRPVRPVPQERLGQLPGRHRAPPFPSIRESSSLWLGPPNSTSLPWCTTRSTIAAASLSSANTVPHLLNSTFVVNTTLLLS